MQKTNYKYFRLYSYLSLGVIMYLLFVLINPFDDFFKYYTKYKVIDYFIEIFYMLLFTAITVESGFLVTRIMNKHLPWEISPRIRFVFQLLIQISILIIVFYGLFKLTGGITFNEPQPVNGLLLRQAIVLSILISLLNTAIFTAEYFFNKWGDAKMEGLQLKQHAIQAQLDALKAQIDPHFLFNNFSALAALIDDNKELSIKFLQRLSQVYRYLLSNRSQNIISLGDELAFITAYFFLYQIRYENGIQLQVTVPKEMYGKGIAPITLQLLLENAIKHNTASEHEPLIVKVYTEPGYLVVENNINIKTHEEPSLKMGLKNIEERYRLLSDNVPLIFKNKQIFQVKVPLLKYEN